MYSGWKIEEIEAELERLSAILVDVRMVPRSRAPIWNSGVLARRLNDPSAGSGQGRYVWIRELGNRNYKGTVDQIAKSPTSPPANSMRELLALSPAEGTATGKAVVLLCGCPDVNQCHRKLLADWLAKLWKAEVVHLTRPDNQISSGQGTLF